MDDILSKVQEILQDPEKLDGFKNLASSLLNQDNNLNTKNIEINKINKTPNIEKILKNFVDNKNNNITKDQLDLPINIEAILKLKNAMEVMNQDDKNIIFLRSLKTLLCDEKQQKVDSAIKIIRLIKLLPIIKDLDILKDFKII
ncbi:MAG: hypothetical protein J6C55_01350 [Oscillospiraceae bacterium]|nr:hypothetical protein [Oscillospiraceae bacterium]